MTTPWHFECHWPPGQPRSRGRASYVRRPCVKMGHDGPIAEAFAQRVTPDLARARGRCDLCRFAAGGVARSHERHTARRLFDLTDPSFAKAVVLVLRHDTVAPLGVVQNRPTNLEPAKIFPELVESVGLLHGQAVSRRADRTGPATVPRARPRGRYGDGARGARQGVLEYRGRLVGRLEPPPRRRHR